ncbi:hypothetical protein XBFFL1_280035 [Xenorhabdus bovienii str. feltiae Florida]|nr:hypothetical protein XBFFR1_660035 [Xenorhabdus bovienii str. feltiae France]CDG93954.1 hypothetical protein XBFFL1_280035 [Xenorhabdus bovienii str. feltiae Florida]
MDIDQQSDMGSHTVILNVAADAIGRKPKTVPENTGWEMGIEYG